MNFYCFSLYPYISVANELFVVLTCFLALMRLSIA